MTCQNDTFLKAFWEHLTKVFIDVCICIFTLFSATSIQQNAGIDENMCPLSYNLPRIKRPFLILSALHSTSGMNPSQQPFTSRRKYGSFRWNKHWSTKTPRLWSVTVSKSEISDSEQMRTTKVLLTLCMEYFQMKSYEQSTQQDNRRWTTHVSSD